MWKYVGKRVGEYSESIPRLKREKQVFQESAQNTTRFSTRNATDQRLMHLQGVLILKGLFLHAAIATFLLSGSSVSAQPAMTADELLARGVSSYSHGRFGESAELFLQFLNDFSASEEAAEAVQRVKPLLALSYIRTKALEEALPFIEDSLTTGNLDLKLSEELSFWKGVCEFNAGSYRTARQTFLAFREQFPNSARAMEATVMSGTTFLLSGDNKSASDFFAKVRPQLNGIERGRVVILELNALITSDRLDEAKDLALSEYRNTDDILQIVTFQTLLLNLGANFLDQGRYTDSIACLQLIWSREQLIKHQNSRLKTLEYQLEATRKRGSDVYQEIQLGKMIGKVRRELENFQKIKSFDAATRMRLARAFQERHRYREAALVMQNIVESLPADGLVEQASINLVRCWLQVGHWKRAIAAADQFAKKFPSSENLALVHFMKGQAQQEDDQYENSVTTFDKLVDNFPLSEMAPRAMFMSGFGDLLQESYLLAVEKFEALPKKYKDRSMVESALFWKGMALSLAKRHRQCRALMAEYLNEYESNGRYLDKATFRHAYSAQALGDYTTSIQELETYLREFPGEAENSEALILLGDALMATGKIEEGISRLKQISPTDTKFFEEGWFKIGKALRLQEKHDVLRDHMEKFRTKHPQSTRIAEAVYWIGWTHLQAGRKNEARETYWKAINELGNDPGARGVEDIFRGLPRLFSEEDFGSLEQRMRQLLAKAEEEKQGTLATRILWAQAQQVERREPNRANLLYRSGAGRADVRSTSSVLLADFADALRIGGEAEQAQQMYRDLLKWNPRAIEKDRAYAGLGLIAMAKGKRSRALEYFDKFERQSAGSRLFGEIMLAKAKLLTSENRSEEARDTLNIVLESSSASSREKAEALIAMGDLMMGQQKFSPAVAYYQRVYVLYRRWLPLVAHAYLRSGEAFEALDDKSAAVRTYWEMLNDDELAKTPEVQTARERLEALGSGSLSEADAA